jgi:hypothetical protein
VRFWDTSALVPLLLEQEASKEVANLLSQDPEVAAWKGALWSVFRRPPCPLLIPPLPLARPADGSAAQSARAVRPPAPSHG